MVVVGRPDDLFGGVLFVVKSGGDVDVVGLALCFFGSS